MTQIITDWIPVPECKCMFRFVGPEWVARLLCWYPFEKDGASIRLVNRLIRPAFRLVARLCGARLEWTESNEIPTPIGTCFTLADNFGIHSRHDEVFKDQT